MTTSSEDPQYNKLAAFFASYFHDEPDDLKAILSAVKVLADNQNERRELYKAFEGLQKTPLGENDLRDFVRGYANRNAQDDEQALQFIAKIQKEIGLDIEPL